MGKRVHMFAFIIDDVLPRTDTLDTYKVKYTNTSISKYYDEKYSKENFTARKSASTVKQNHDVKIKTHCHLVV